MDAYCDDEALLVHAARSPSVDSWRDPYADAIVEAEEGVSTSKIIKHSQSLPANLSVAALFLANCLGSQSAHTNTTHTRPHGSTAIHTHECALPLQHNSLNPIPL